MIRRPVFAILRTLPHQYPARAILQASACLVARPAPFSGAYGIPRALRATRSLSSTIPRSSTTFENDNRKEEEVQNHGTLKEASIEAEVEEKEQDELPWYMQIEPPTPAPHLEPAPLPPLPESPPRLLEPLLKYVYEEMGLDELTMLDLREFDPPPALGPNLIMIFGTARSERHLHVACGRLVRWLRYHFKVEAVADGLIGAAELKTKLRRMRRKAKLLGTSTITSQDEDDGIRTGWICVNMDTGTSNKAEEARLDESGQLSGFGTSTPQLRTSTIVVQAMTESRREELDLETLWRDSLAENKMYKEQVGQPGTADEIAALKAAANPATSAKVRERQERTRKRLAQKALRPQKRAYSTSRDVPTSSTGSGSGSGSGSESGSGSSTFGEARGKPQAVHWASTDSPSATESITEAGRTVYDRRARWKSLTLDEYCDLVERIFPPDATEAHAEQQLTILETLVRLRVGPVTRATPLRNEVLIPLIAAIARAPYTARSPMLQQAQANLEELFTTYNLPCPNERYTIQLLDAYAIQGNWDSFWATWRRPPLYQVSRSRNLYMYMLTTVAAHGTTATCLEALRQYVPEMEFERPPVVPAGGLRDALMAVISIVDPRAEEDAEKIARGETWRSNLYTGSQANKWKESRARILFDREQHREFVQLVRLVNHINDLYRAPEFVATSEGESRAKQEGEEDWKGKQGSAIKEDSESKKDS